MKKIALLAAATAALSFATAAQANTTFDPATGTGFLAKGDVQLTLGWNNKGLQDGAATLAVTYEATTITEQSWTCQRLDSPGNDNIQERERTATTSISGVVTTVARVRNQITGFNLTGITATTSTSETSGPKLNTCPNFWTLTIPAGDAETITSTGGLKVNGMPLVISTL